jgi:hypothetical protein
VKEEVHNEELLPLAKIRGKVVSQYQKQLESNFISSLKTKFKVDVNQEEYQKLIKY